MMKKKILATAVLAGLAAGVASPAHAVRMSENGVGQVLLGTQYVLTNIPGSTEQYTGNTIRVVNPSLTNAVKAKLVLRSQKYSLECFDTILYLTPGDVAVVNLSVLNGNLRVSSSDDSLKSRQGGTGSPLDANFASQTGFALGYDDTRSGNGIAADRVVGKVVVESELASFQTSNVPALTATNAAGDTCLTGHVEVIGAYAVSDRVSTDTGVVTIAQRMSKYELNRVFSTSKATLNGRNTTNVTNNLAFATRQARIDDYSNRVQIYGFIDVAKSDDRISTPLVALREGVNFLTTNSTPVISHPTFDVTIGAESGLGLGFSDRIISGVASTDLTTLTVAGNAATDDNIPDLEAAMADSRLYGLYDNTARNSIFAAVSFPTKYRHRGGKAPFNTTTWGVPFFNDAFGSVQWRSTIYDEQENFKVVAPGAVCVISPCPITGPSAAQALNFEVNFTQIAAAADFQLTDAGGVNIASGPSVRGWYSYGLFGRGDANWQYSTGPDNTTSTGLNTYFVAGAGAGTVPVIGYTQNFFIENGRIVRSVVEPLSRDNTVNSN